MSSGGSGWIYIKFKHFLIKHQLKSQLWRLRLDLYQIRSFLNKESIKESALEAQAGSI